LRDAYSQGVTNWETAMEQVLASLEAAVNAAGMATVYNDADWTAFEKTRDDVPPLTELPH